MATLESVMSGARSYMRDHPRFFSAAISSTGLTRTFKLPHVNVLPFGLYVVASDGSTAATGVHDSATFNPSDTTFSYVIDEREGLLRIAKQRTGGGFNGNWAFNIEGYFYEWVADTDLRFFANNIIAEHAYHRADFCIDDISDLEEDAMSLGTACEAFWSLLAEYSRDIDINTPEGISVPATQRYRQVEDLLFSGNGLLAKYKEKAHMLGVGLDRIEVFTLRRVSRTTDRLVPVYKPREWDDASRPVRVFPPIDQMGPTSPPPSFTPAASVTNPDPAVPNP